MRERRARKKAFILEVYSKYKAIKIVNITLATRMATMPIVNPLPPFDPGSDIGAQVLENMADRLRDVCTTPGARAP